MEDIDWQEDAAELERDRLTLKNLTMSLAPGKTVTYEASDSVDRITRKLLERSWRDHGAVGDTNREIVKELLKRAQKLRRSVSRVTSDKYEQEYQSWVDSWRQE